jgi:hypothetical protein
VAAVTPGWHWPFPADVEQKLMVEEDRKVGHEIEQGVVSMCLPLGVPRQPKQHLPSEE